MNRSPRVCDDTGSRGRRARSVRAGTKDKVQEELRPAAKFLQTKAIIGQECKGCGRCAMVRKRDAVRITVEPADYVEHFIACISTLVDVK